MTTPFQPTGFFWRLRVEALKLAALYCEEQVLELDANSYELIPFCCPGEFHGQVQLTVMTPGFQLQYLFLSVEPCDLGLRITIANFNPSGIVPLQDLKARWQQRLLDKPKSQSAVVAEALYENWKRDGKLP